MSKTRNLWFYEITVTDGLVIAVRAYDKYWAIMTLIVDGRATMDTISGCELIG